MKKSYAQLIKETLDESLEKDPSVFIIGEDIGKYGGCFGATRGLLEKYGPKRVIDTPMSEQAIVGLGIGAAINGLKPIVEIMFMDFMTLAYDQLFNHASIFCYLTHGEVNVPMVIRVAAGAGRGYGATHSKSIIAPLMHIPGIKIVAPYRNSDVKGLLKASIQDKNPVIFIENKVLYGVEGEEENYPEFIPLGKANIIREGKDLLIITYSKSVRDCLEVAEACAKKNVSIEIIDLRTIKPLDMQTIRSSVKRIGKVLIVEEGYSECGVGAEIIARINEECFYSLDSSVRRVCTVDVPIPCAPDLERKVLPTAERIEKEVWSILSE